ncbi:cytidylate kinase family protein [Candidatus Woesearchaeota archaeon]|nr:cytidylate kinase family protein [Candidatus Woesearchaeota archaeon]
MIITLSGTPGSGKSTVAKLLARRLELKHYSVGDLRGKMALEKGMTIDELNALGEKESWTDQDADEYQRKLGKSEDNFIIDGRLSWHFIPHSFKVFLNVDKKEGAKRIFRAVKRPDEKEYKSAAEVLKEAQKRIASDKKRYKKYYGINPYLKRHYDLWIDTTRIPSEKVAEKIVENLKRKTHE